MNAIRFIGAVGLAGTLAGCAGTKDIPGIGSTTPAPDKTVTKAAPPIVTPKTASDLPERVAALPRYAPAPVAPVRAAPVQDAPLQGAPLQDAPVQSVPRYTTESVAAPQASYEPVETVAPPRYDSVETVAVPSYEPVKAAPAYEPVETAAPSPAPKPMAFARPDPAQYTPLGDLDARSPAPVAAPAYVMAEPGRAAPLSRAMAPIRDDPQDGRNGRRTSNAEIRQHARKGYRRNAALRAGGLKPKVRSNFTPAFGMKLEDAALSRLNPSIRYDARYVKIGYPWGDVDESTGVCSDVIIRSYRKLGIDLQSLIHEDMKRAFRAYPSKRIYGLKKADPNIDHRRVVNMEAFFERTGASIPIGTSPEDFQPGDVLTWRLSGNEPHVGIVVSDRDPRSGYPLVVHNLGAGVRKDDLITLSTPVGHFRFAPETDTVVASLAR